MRKANLAAFQSAAHHVREERHVCLAGMLGGTGLGWLVKRFIATAPHVVLVDALEVLALAGASGVVLTVAVIIENARG